VSQYNKKSNILIHTISTVLFLHIPYISQMNPLFSPGSMCQTMVASQVLTHSSSHILIPQPPLLHQQIFSAALIKSPFTNSHHSLYPLQSFLWPSTACLMRHKNSSRISSSNCHTCNAYGIQTHGTCSSSILWTTHQLLTAYDLTHTLHLI